MHTKWTLPLILVILVIILCGSSVLAMPADQESIWQRIDRSQLQQPGFDSRNLPNAYEAFRLNKGALEVVLSQAPEEFTAGSRIILVFLCRTGR